MKNRYILWLGLFVWLVVGSIWALVGNSEMAEVSSMVGAMICCIYGIKRIDAEQNKGEKQ